MRVLPLAAVLAAPLLTGPLSSVPAMAQLTTDPSKVQTGTFNADPDHTLVTFAVDHFGLSTYYGRFALPTGTLSLAPGNPAGASVVITVPVGTVSTPSAKLTSELKSADWLDADKFPTMTFRSTSVTPTGAETADVTGDLTLHGVTKPLTLHVKLHAAGPNPIFKMYTVGFDATGELKRSDFGVTKYVPVIGDTVSLTVSAAFVKQ